MDKTPPGRWRFWQGVQVDGGPIGEETVRASGGGGGERGVESDGVTASRVEMGRVQAGSVEPGDAMMLPDGIRDRAARNPFHARFHALPGAGPRALPRALPHARPDARSTRARTAVRWLCATGGIGIGLATAAYFGASSSAPGTRSALAAAPFTAIPREGDVPYRVGDVDLSVHPRTLEVIEWFDARGLLLSVGLDPDGRVDRVICAVIPAAGVALPETSFRSTGIRFNAVGEVVEILPASSEDDACELFIVLEDPTARNWIYSCFGRGPSANACVLGINLPTLEITASCIP